MAFPAGFSVGRTLPFPADDDAGNDAARPGVPAQVDVAVVGAGIVGLSIAWRLARRGLAVAVFDRGAVGGGASLAATGMLAAAAELEPGGSELLPLCLESQSLWPAFRDELEEAAGMSVDYRSEGTLLVALGRDEVARLRSRYDLQCRAGLSVEWLGGPEVRAIEPGLRPSAAAGIFCRDDHQVDPRRVVSALRRALARCGAHVIENCAPEALLQAAGRVAGLQFADASCRAPVVVVATGAWAAVNDGLLAGLMLPVRPLKGQALALRSPAEALRRVVWTEQVHLAPKAGGLLIVGATVEEAGFDAAVTAGGVYALLEGARRALPSTEEMTVEAIWTGLRPTSDDDAPIIGPAGLDGLLVATGHHRNGVLLAPVTARAVAELVLRGQVSGAAAAFGIERFDRRPARQTRIFGECG